IDSRGASLPLRPRCPGALSGCSGHSASLHVPPQGARATDVRGLVFTAWWQKPRTSVARPKLRQDATAKLERFVAARARWDKAEPYHSREEQCFARRAARTR